MNKNEQRLNSIFTKSKYSVDFMNKKSFISMIVMFSFLTIILFGVVSQISPINAANSTTIDNTTEGGIQSAVNSGYDTINLNKGIYSTNNANITIDRKVSINGKGKSSEVIVDLNKKGRAFLITTNGSLSLTNITFINGNLSSGSAYGGVVNNVGNLSIESCNFINNSVSGSSCLGGVIYNSGKCNISYSNFINSTANGSGGGGTLENRGNGVVFIQYCNFSSSVAITGSGGTLQTYNTLTIYNSNFNNCSGSSGGAINRLSGNVNVYNSNFTSNRGAGGAISAGCYIVNSTFINNTNNGHPSTGAGAVNGGTIINSTFINNTGINGGAIGGSGTITNCTFIGNKATNGGAVYVAPGSTIRITGSKFINNTATGNGDAISSNGTINANYCVFDNNIEGRVNQTVYTSNTNYNLNYNYWGTNDITNITNGNISQYYVIKIEKTNKTNPKIAGDQIEVLYSLVLNGTNDSESSAQLPYFEVLVYCNNELITIIDGRNFNKTYNISTNGRNNNITIIGGASSGNINRDPIHFDIDNLNPATTHIVIEDIHGNYNQIIAINATLLNQDEKGIANKYITFYINGIEIGKNKTNSEGIAFIHYNCQNKGTFNITANFTWTPGLDGNDEGSENDFTNSTNSSNLIISPTNTYIVISNFSSKLKTQFTLNATLFDEFKNPIVGKTITFYINDTLIGSGITDEKGIAFLNYTSNYIGNFQIKANFTDDDSQNYINSFNSSNLNIFKVTEIQISNITSVYNKNIVLTANLSENDEFNTLIPLNGKVIKFYINNTFIGTNTTNSNGIAIYNYNYTLGVGTWNLKVLFESDEEYSGSNNSGELVITPLNDAYIKVNNFTTNYNKYVQLTATLLDDINQAIVGKTISFYINETLIGTNTTNTNGIATYNYLTNRLNSVGTYTVSFIFNEDNDCKSVSNSSNLTINKANTKIIINDIIGEYLQDIILEATLIDSEGNPLSQKKVEFYINNEYIDYELTNTLGIASLYYKCNSTGTLTFKVIFQGDNNFNENTSISSLKVSKLNTKIVVNDINCNYGEKVTIHSNLLDKNGNPIANKKLKFYINNVLIGENITNDEGLCYYTFTCNIPGKSTIKTVFEGDNNYNSNYTLSSMTSPKFNTNIISYNFDTYYNGIVTLKAILLDQHNKNVSGKILHFYLNNKLIGQGKTDINGLAKIKYIPTFINTNVLVKNIKVTFNGDSTHNSFSRLANLKVVKAKSYISLHKFTGKYNKKGIFSVILKGQNKKIVTNKYIKFYIKGKYVGKAKTNSKGIATLKSKIKVKGKVKILAKMDTNANYYGSKFSKSVKIKS